MLNFSDFFSSLNHIRMNKLIGQIIGLIKTICPINSMNHALFSVPVNNIYNNLVFLQLGQIVKQDIMFFRIG